MFNILQMCMLSILLTSTQTHTTSWFSFKKEEKTITDKSMNKEMTVDSLKQKIATEKNIIILFSADYCPYCHFMIPIINEVKELYKSSITFEIVDIAQGKSDYPSAFTFKTIPTVIYYKDGVEQKRHGSENKSISSNDIKKNITDIYKL